MNRTKISETQFKQWGERVDALIAAGHTTWDAFRSNVESAIAELEVGFKKLAKNEPKLESKERVQ